MTKDPEKKIKSRIGLFLGQLFSFQIVFILGYMHDFVGL